MYQPYHRELPHSHPKHLHPNPTSKVALDGCPDHQPPINRDQQKVVSRESSGRNLTTMELIMTIMRLCDVGEVTLRPTWWGQVHVGTYVLGL